MSSQGGWDPDAVAPPLGDVYERGAKEPVWCMPEWFLVAVGLILVIVALNWGI